MEYLSTYLAVFLLFLSKVLAEGETKGYLRREHSVLKGAGPSIPYWDFLGSTFISSSYIRLTPDHQSKKGGLWNNVPCHVKDWEMLIHFKVHGAGDTLFGDGFAFWYSKDRMQEGDVFGSKDYFYGLAVFFDTYSNHNGEHQHDHPYISVMVGNGSLHYDHDRDGTHSQVAGCSQSFRGRGHDTYALIRYSGTQNRLTVHNTTDSSMKPNLPDECVTPLLSCYLMATIRAVKRGQLSSASNTVFSKDSPFMIKKPSSQYCAMLKCLILVDVENKNEWEDCLDVGGVKLPTGLYFGTTAATGQLADNHDIISLKFYETEMPVSSDSKGADEDRTKIVPFASGAEQYRERVEDVQGSFSSKTVKVFSWLFWFALVAVCVVGVSIYVYQKRQEDSRKRFY